MTEEKRNKGYRATRSGYKQLPAMLPLRDYLRLQGIKEDISDAYNISLPLSEMIRDAVYLMLQNELKDVDTVEKYLRIKGLIV